MEILFVLLCFFVYQISCQENSDGSFNCSNWRQKLDAEGNIIFIAGDRGYVPPQTIAEIHPLYCDRQTLSLGKIRALGRNCMKPFPRQIIGLMTYGSRKEVKALCKGPVSGKQELLDNNHCFRDPQKLNQMHDFMDTMIIKYEIIRDNVHNESLKLPHLCCTYNSFLDELKVEFYRICANKEIDYWIRLTEKKLDDSLDIMCAGYKRGSPSNKCSEFTQNNPLIIPPKKKRQSVSIVLALVDTLSQLATEDDGQVWHENK